MAILRQKVIISDLYRRPDPPFWGHFGNILVIFGDFRGVLGGFGAKMTPFLSFLAEKWPV